MSKSDLEFVVEFGCTPKQTAKIVEMLEDGTINRNGAREVARELRQRNRSVVGAIYKAMVDEELDSYESVRARVGELLDE